MKQKIIINNHEEHIHYVSTGTKDQPVVLLIHGLGCNLNYWDQVIKDPQITQNARIIAVDLLGYGSSSKPSPKKFDYSMKAQAQALNQFLKEINVVPDILVGFSMGGPIAIHLANMIPPSKLVLVEPTLIENDLSFSKTLSKTPTPVLGALKIMTHISPWSFAKSVLHHKNKEAIKIIVKALQQTPARVMQQSSKQLVLSATSSETYSSLKQLKTEKTVIIGEFLDRSRHYKPPADLFQISTKKVVPQSKHAVMLDNPVEFNKILLEIITKK